MLNIVIIGGGGTGSAAARFLAREGHQVTVFERFTLDHDQGSSFGGSRIIRRTYPDALYTRMMAAAYDLWAELAAEAGEELFERCGGLTFGQRDNTAMTQTEESLRVNGVAYERLSAAEVVERFPPFRLDEGQYGIYQADSGFLRASQCVRAQMHLAREAGTTLIENAQVESVRTMEDGTLVVGWGRGEAAFDRVILTVGPWMGQMLPGLRLPLTVTRQYYAHLDAGYGGGDFAVGAFPVWIDADSNFYGFPAQGDLPGVKVAWHGHGRAVDPDDVPRDVEAADRALLTDYALERLPGLHGPPLFEKTCLYTNTPTEDFIIDAVPGLPGAFLCSGCSGHGFKFTVLLGRIMADLASGQAASQDLTRFGLRNFGQQL